VEGVTMDLLIRLILTWLTLVRNCLRKLCRGL
jgi:hypothetical protein